MGVKFHPHKVCQLVVFCLIAIDSYGSVGLYLVRRGCKIYHVFDLATDVDATV